ncbi:MAG TPA: hypothetical protein VJ020_02560 [Anaerolineales bacterium]|nr:hypothetical protein [Anaerolineales bacterium]
MVPLPPLTEQRRVVAEVERRLSVVAEMETTVAHNLARAGRLRQAVLKRAFAGKLVAQDPNDEAAERLVERVKAEREKGLAKAEKKNPSPQTKTRRKVKA